MVYSALSATGVVSQFTRRKAIKITTAGTSTPATYQIKLTIAYEPQMQASFQDIRFNTWGNVYIDYWIESYTASTTATVWIELPDAITDPGSDSIWMYYGNAAAASESNGTNTFLFFDDFDDGIIGSIWTTIAGTPVESGGVLNINGGYVGLRSTSIFQYPLTMEFKRKENIYAYYGITGFDDGTIGPSYYATFASTGVTTIWAFYGWTVGGNYYNYGNLGTNYINYRIDWINSTTIRFSYNNGNFQTGTATGPIANKYIQISDSQDANNPDFDVDWLFVRKYIAIEPTATLGTAQHQRRVPRFL